MRHKTLKKSSLWPELKEAHEKQIHFIVIKLKKTLKRRKEAIKRCSLWFIIYKKMLPGSIWSIKEEKLFSLFFQQYLKLSFVVVDFGDLSQPTVTSSLKLFMPFSLKHSKFNRRFNYENHLSDSKLLTCFSAVNFQLKAGKCSSITEGFQQRCNDVIIFALLLISLSFFSRESDKLFALFYGYGLLSCVNSKKHRQEMLWWKHLERKGWIG